MPVQLSPIASTFLVIFYVFSALILVVLLGILVFLVLKLNALLEKYEQKIDPLLIKADAVLTVTNDKVNSIGSKAEEILTQGEEITEMVHTRVDTTTLAVHRTVFTPLIGVNSLIAGIKRGAETFARSQQKTLTDVSQKKIEPWSIEQTKISTGIHLEDVEPVEDALTEIETKNSINAAETMNLPTISSVNTNGSNRAEPQLITVGSRKENG